MAYTFTHTITMMACAAIDPRPAKRDEMEQLLQEAARNGGVFGIEVTLPWATEYLGGNLDHHGLGSTADTPSAIEQALTCPMPPLGATLVTVRADADSIGAMAVLQNRLNQRHINTALVETIGAFDRLGPASFVTLNVRPELAKLARACARKAGDFKLPFEERVRWVMDALAGDYDIDAKLGCGEVGELVAAAEADLEAARAASEITLVADGKIAVVRSSHRFATTLGYENAPIVVAWNPAMPVDFRDPSQGSYSKFTVCRYDDHVAVDMTGTLEELNSLEDTADGLTWGGQANIVGSPQGRDSSLTLDEVVEVVKRHLG